MTLWDVTTAAIGVCSALDIAARRLGAMSPGVHRIGPQVGYFILAAVCLWCAYLSTTEAAGRISDAVVMCVAVYLAATWEQWQGGPPLDMQKEFRHSELQPARIRGNDWPQ